VAPGSGYLAGKCDHHTSKIAGGGRERPAGAACGARRGPRVAPGGGRERHAPGPGAAPDGRRAAGGRGAGRSAGRGRV